MPVFVQRGNNDVRWLVVAHLHNHVREIGLPRRDVVLFQRGVHADLITGHRLDLDDLGMGVRLLLRRSIDQFDGDGVRFIGIASPMHLPASSDAVALKHLEVVRQMQQGMRLDGVARRAQVLPVRHLFHAQRALVADDIRCVAHVAARLVVLQNVMRQDGEGSLLSRVSYANAHAVASSHARDSAVSGLAFVLFRISARCTGRMRPSAPLPFDSR